MASSSGARALARLARGACRRSQALPCALAAARCAAPPALLPHLRAASAAAAAPLADSALAPPQRAGPAPEARPAAPRNAADVRRDGASIDLKAKAIFDSCFRKLEEKLGFAAMQAPREVVWLNGAPGSGKGTNTPFIQRSRGLARAVCVSSLLAAEQQAAINAGALVSDATVVELLLSALLDPAHGADAAGAVVDGFPRTPLQVDFLCLLFDKLTELHLRHADSPSLSARFPRPHFRLVVLFVGEEESVRRQLARGAAAAVLHARARDAGVPHAAAAARATDASEAVARGRYHTFRRHYGTLLRLKERFPFTLVDACGALADTEAQIATELRYQSSLELSERAYAAIRAVPLAVELVRDARRQLVSRLDAAAARQPAILADVVALAEESVAPVLRRAALAGRATWRSAAPLFEREPAAADMLVDVLSDRGFAVRHERRAWEVPSRFDPATGAVECVTRVEHCFHIAFERALLRQEGLPRTQHAAAAAAVAVPATLAVPSSEPLQALLARVAPVAAAAAAQQMRHDDDRMLHAAFDATAAPRAPRAAGVGGGSAMLAPAEAWGLGATAAAAQQQHNEEDVTEVSLVQRH